ncbi:MAG: ribonuclease M5 [Candidatus Izemoplasmataceae bacterium]
MNESDPVIVVEGNHDKAKVHEVYPHADVMITNGSEIPSATLKALEHANKVRGLILMLDPDAPGEKIRRRIVDAVGPTDHVFLKKAACIDRQKGKVGIEHASRATIKEALSNHVQSDQGTEPTLTKSDLYELNLLGTVNARKNREFITDHFAIGHANGKTLLKKLTMFGITKDALERVVG